MKFIALLLLASSTAFTAPHVKGLRFPLGWERSAPFKRVVKKNLPALPSKFSLADKWGKLPPVRDQKQCGDCFVFATTGAVELGYFWKTGVVIDLSEQQVLSCAGAGDCENGGYFNTLDYMKSTGVTSETIWPYAAADLQCRKGLLPIAWAKDWHYIGENAARGPQLDDIKRQILSGVPVPATIAADRNFENYTGGVFSGRSLCTGRTPDHMIMLVGWDDTAGVKSNGKPQGAWLLRNSWGDSWGEHGYMRIAYGCDLVAGVAAAVTVP